MRILWVTARLPLPGTKGDALRAFHLLRHLSAEHEVDVLSFVASKKEREDAAQLAPYCRSVRTVLLPRLWALMKMLLCAFSLQPFQVIYYSSLRMHLAIRRALREREYDVVHVCPARMMSYHACFRNVPLVVDLVDSLSLNMKRRAFRERNPFKKLLFHLEAWKMARYEAWVTQTYDHGAITSDVDRRAIRGNHIDVIPNGVDLFRFRPRAAEKKIDAIFTGNMGYFPNVDAATSFATRIRPLIDARRPDFTFFVVGADPAKSLQRLADGKRTVVTGFVPDITEYLAGSKVFVAPLSVGSGIQNKVLEAMACGLPVVATPRANAAIGARDGEEIVLAETPEEFADAVLHLLESPQTRERIGNGARRCVAERFGWDAKARLLVETYRKAITLFEMKEFERSTGRLPIYFYDRERPHAADPSLLAGGASRAARLFDAVAAALGLVLASPILLLTALAVWLVDGAPVLYRQDRVGLGGRTFRLYKFRTMTLDAEADGHPRFCAPGDHRVTRLGRILRKTRVDELPQLWNVLKGEMSLIGPRPERPEFARDFAQRIPLYAVRHAVKPGLTGWAQVKHAYASTLEDTIRKLQYDLYYIKNRSARMNLAILLQTVSVVLTGKGAR